MIDDLCSFLYLLFAYWYVHCLALVSISISNLLSFIFETLCLSFSLTFICLLVCSQLIIRFYIYHITFQSQIFSKSCLLVCFWSFSFSIICISVTLKSDCISMIKSYSDVFIPIICLIFNSVSDFLYHLFSCCVGIVCRLKCLKNFNKNQPKLLHEKNCPLLLQQQGENKRKQNNNFYTTYKNCIKF